jgi:ABC-type multidrug transport system fused ATPase/permease subunit
LVKEFSELMDYKMFNDQKTAKMVFSKVINLQSICYRYEGTTAFVLNDLNLKIMKNTTIGLVGPSGGGKTTLVDIILGLLTQNSGNYVVDGVEIDHNNIAIWQKFFGYVPQSIFLMDDSIARNIAFAVSDDKVDFDKVVRSAQLAELDGFVNTLPEGYETHVGDRGVRLSGGQRQRIGIARALYFDPEVLVLDEATSALDGISENVIMDAIHNLSHKKTIIIIAHRLKTVRECDVIHFMNNTIVNSGTYESLIKNNANFKEMAEIQR